jgi:DNA-binding CsgD family transcriptional regulator
MALTSSDETDLLLPLLQTTAETAPFATFLERLRRRAGVTYVSLIIRSGDGQSVIDFFAGPNVRQRAHHLGLEELNLIDRAAYDRLRKGRVYTGDEFDDHDLARKAVRARSMRRLGLIDERVVRLIDADGIGAWLVLAADRLCTAADSALLSSLAPYAAAAVRNFVATERQALVQAFDEEGLRRAGSGWIVFDKVARVLALAPGTAQLFTQAFGHPPAMGQRLREAGPAAERALAEAATAFAQATDAPERTLLLLAEPRIEAILAALRVPDGTHLDTPTMIAHCRQVRTPAAGRAGHLARLHDLPRREAELAILLADGLSLAEAGTAMKLTIETTRNYSKRLFAKLGVRGQAELVRAVYESCAMLA